MPILPTWEEYQTGIKTPCLYFTEKETVQRSFSSLSPKVARVAFPEYQVAGLGPHTT